MILQLTNVFGKIILMMAFGFILSKTGIMTETMKKNLSTLLVKGILPINILSSASQPFSQENARGMLQVLIISLLYYLLSLFVLSICTRRMQNVKKRNVLINLAVFANVGFVGFPILGELYGMTGTLYTVAYNISYQLFFFSYGMFLLKEDGKLSIKSLFQNSIIYVSLLSILLYFSGFRFPVFIQETMSSIGGIMIPVSMMIIGWEIAHTKVKELYCDYLSYLISVLRLLVFPLVMALLLKGIGISSQVAEAIVLLTALPCGSLTVIVAQENGTDSSFSARAVAQSTLLMIITLPIIFIFTEWFL